VRALLSLCLLTSLAACVVVPHSVEPEVTESETAVLPAEEILLTLGPRAFLEQMEQAIGEADPGIEIADALAFRDTAFPEGDWSLAQLLTAESCERIQRQMPVDYLLLFGPLQQQEGSLKGPNFMTLGMPLPFGLGTAESKSTLSAVVIDLKVGEIVCQIDVSAEGSTSFVAWVYIVGTYPATGDSAAQGLAEELVAEIREISGEEHPSVVLMAAEASQLWKPIGAGGWTRIEPRDGGPVYYRLFGVCGEADGTLTLSQAYGRARKYYEVQDYPAAHECFQFVIEAGNDHTLVGDAQRHISFMRDTGLIPTEDQAPTTAPQEWTPGGGP
jgi:hypothetical protein